MTKETLAKIEAAMREEINFDVDDEVRILAHWELGEIDYCAVAVWNRTHKWNHSDKIIKIGHDGRINISHHINWG